MAMTSAGLSKGMQLAARLKNQLANVKEKSEEGVRMALQTVEVGGSSFGFSYANVRYGNGELKVFGLPADLAAGIGLHVVALFGAAGKYGEHVHNLGDGALAAYAARLGATMGQQALQTAQQAPQQMPAGGTGWAPPQQSAWQQAA